MKMPNERHVEILAEAYDVTPEYVMRNLHIYQAELTALATLQGECDEERIVKVNQALFYQRAAELNNDITKALLLEAEATIATLKEEVERRRDLILSEPNGAVRETMIQNLLIGL